MYIQNFASHSSRVILPTAVYLPKATTAYDTVNGKVLWSDHLGLNDLKVLPLAKTDVMWTEGVGGEGRRERGRKCVFITHTEVSHSQNADTHTHTHTHNQ